jgi:WD40 repeat protein
MVAFADAGFLPARWVHHPGTGHILCAEDQNVRERYDCVALDLEHDGKVATRLVSHRDVVSQLSVSEENTHAFVTPSEDGCARLWDVQEHLPVLTFDVEWHEAVCHTAIYVHINGLPP